MVWGRVTGEVGKAPSQNVSLGALGGAPSMRLSTPQLHLCLPVHLARGTCTHAHAHGR